MQRCILFFLGLTISFALTAQTTVSIPAYTAYAVPAEKNEEDMFSDKTGLSGWSNPKQKIEFHFYLRDTGKLVLNLDAKNALANSTVTIEIAGSRFTVNIPKSNSYQSTKKHTVQILQPGYYTAVLSLMSAAGKTDIRSLQLSGDAINNIHFNKMPRRNAASVHLKYPLDDSLKAIQFYDEVTVPKGNDIVHSYYMATGFSRGYFGIQVNGEKERRVIFSIWDAGNEAVDRNKVADSNKVQLMAKGEDVVAEGFGNEGTGGHSHWVYDWKADSTYKFLVTIIPDSATKTTIYTGYFYMPEKKLWKLIASFKAPRDGNYLHGLYSFNENFVGINGQLQRKAYFGNQWVQGSNQRWVELTQAKFSYDATGKAGDRIDYGGGTDDYNRFYLWNGGFQPSNAAYNNTFTRMPNKQRPVIDVTKNIDSAAELQRETKEIMDAIAAKKIDTTGSIDGVYYQILKEGTGRFVSANDTAVCFYKGSLLKDGSVFDGTKGDKTVAFPLKRLIKGWQLGLAACKVGGKIRLIIPSSLGYSIRSRSKDIPPNSVLVFDIEVIGVK